jgi:hypothetical protein
MKTQRGEQRWNTGETKTEDMLRKARALNPSLAAQWSTTEIFKQLKDRQGIQAPRQRSPLRKRAAFLGRPRPGVSVSETSTLGQGSQQGLGVAPDALSSCFAEESASSARSHPLWCRFVAVMQ